MTATTATTAAALQAHAEAVARQQRIAIMASIHIGELNAAIAKARLFLLDLYPDGAPHLYTDIDQELWRLAQTGEPYEPWPYPASPTTDTPDDQPA